MKKLYLPSVSLHQQLLMTLSYASRLARPAPTFLFPSAWLGGLSDFVGFIVVACLLRTMFTKASPWSAFCACRHSCRQIRHSRVCSFKVLTGSLLRHVFVALCIGKRLCAMQNGQYCIAERHILPCETGYFAWQDGSSGIEKRSGGGLVVAVSAFHSAKTAFIFA